MYVVSINGGPREYTLNGKQLSQPCATITATIEYLTNGEAGELTCPADRCHSVLQPHVTLNVELLAANNGP